MGYTHYWYSVQELDTENYDKLVKDFQAIVVKLAEGGLELAGWDGKGKPKINDHEITFNGKTDCGHEHRELGITWPADGANRIAKEDSQEVTDGNWFGGALLTSRACGGDCSHETFQLEQSYESRVGQRGVPPDYKMFFACTKTAYKPYDLAVISCLLLAQYHLGDQIRFSSDGGIEDWKDGMELVRAMFGYEIIPQLGD